MLIFKALTPIVQNLASCAQAFFDRGWKFYSNSQRNFIKFSPFSEPYFLTHFSGLLKIFPSLIYCLNYIVSLGLVIIMDHKMIMYILYSIYTVYNVHILYSIYIIQQFIISRKNFDFSVWTLLE